jgi:hypothetical protein
MPACAGAKLTLEPDDFSSNRHPPLSYYLRMIFSETGARFSGSCFNAQ